METVRESWTDARLDDMKQGMDAGFTRVDEEMKAGFARVDKEMKTGFKRVDEEMKAGFARVDGEMKAGFARVDRDIKDLRTEMNQRFDALNRTLLQIGGVVVAALIALVATQL